MILGALAFVAIKNDNHELVWKVVEKVFKALNDNPNDTEKQKVVDEIQKDVSTYLPIFIFALGSFDAKYLT